MYRACPAETLMRSRRDEGFPVRTITLLETGPSSSSSCRRTVACSLAVSTTMGRRVMPSL
eukprot:474471-Hanusia_phi.AAC.1